MYDIMNSLLYCNRICIVWELISALAFITSALLQDLFVNKRNSDVNLLTPNFQWLSFPKRPLKIIYYICLIGIVMRARTNLFYDFGWKLNNYDHFPILVHSYIPIYCILVQFVICVEMFIKNILKAIRVVRNIYSLYIVLFLINTKFITTWQLVTEIQDR